jgi:hypothetical protein
LDLSLESHEKVVLDAPHLDALASQIHSSKIGFADE